MSMFSDYLNERGKKQIIESDQGFITFIINGSECYIEDLYVIPENRHSKVASALADQVTELAKSANCRYLTGSVVPSANYSTESCKVLLSYGFKLLNSKPDMIYFVKEI